MPDTGLTDQLRGPGSPSGVIARGPQLKPRSRTHRKSEDRPIWVNKTGRPRSVGNASADHDDGGLAERLSLLLSKTREAQTSEHLYPGHKKTC